MKRLALAAIVAATLSTVLATAGQTQSSGPSCFGLTQDTIPDDWAWITGEHNDYDPPGDDSSSQVIAGFRDRRNVIIGTSGPDTIIGGGFSDRICGKAGGDFILSRRGRIRGGPGDDVIEGLAGYSGAPSARNMVIRGGSGDDDIQGSVADDRIYGGPGDDILNPYLGDDRVWGNRGDDMIVTSGPTSVFTPGEPPGAGVDIVRGGYGRDGITHGPEDSIRGGPGRDSCIEDDSDPLTPLEERNCA